MHQRPFVLYTRVSVLKKGTWLKWRIYVAVRCPSDQHEKNHGYSAVDTVDGLFWSVSVPFLILILALLGHLGRHFPSSTTLHLFSTFELS